MTSIHGALAVVGRSALYPILLGLIYVLGPFVALELAPQAGIRAGILAVAVGLVLSAAMTRLLGPDRGAAAAALVIMALITASTIPKAAAFVLALILLLIEWYWSRSGMRLRVPWPRITESLNVIIGVLVAMQLIQGVATRLGAPVVASPASWATVAAAAAPRDVIVLILDGHGRGDVLREGYGFDPVELTATLSRLGFVEAERSQANHAYTRFSIPVLLTGRPLAELGMRPEDAIDERIPAAALRDGGLLQVAEAAGYETVIIGSGYEHFGFRTATRFIDAGPINEAEGRLLDGTAVGSLLSNLIGLPVASLRERTFRELDAIREVVNGTGSPLFLVAHLPVPHPPHALTADCGLRSNDRSSLGSGSRGLHAGDEASVGATRDQTACVDHLVAELVEDLVTVNPDAVLIVLSDHGPDERLDWWDPSEPGMAERMANLFWARTPGHDRLFPDDVSLVNVLPILLNAYLVADIETHANDLYFGPLAGGDRLVPYTPPTP